jgi:hypothetical protein
MKTDTSVGTASGFPIPGAAFQLHNGYLNEPSGVGLVVVEMLAALSLCDFTNRVVQGNLSLSAGAKWLAGI